jgi:hypothetical protein
VEPNREEIEDWKRRYGYEEKEAEAAYHLREARNRILELYQADVEAGAGSYPTIYSQMSLQSATVPHFDALFNLLARRVLARQFPEGWGYRPAPEEEG